MKKVKFKDLTENNGFNFLMSNMDALKAEALAFILGGDGCTTGICVNKRDYGAEKYCSGCGVCTSGIGTCQEKTDGLVVPLIPLNPPITIVSADNTDSYLKS